MGLDPLGAGAVTVAETRARHAEYALEWPIEYEGWTIDRITLHRLTGAEVADLQDRMIDKGASEVALIAIFADQPAEVIAALEGAMAREEAANEPS